MALHPDTLKLLSELGRTNYGKALRDYLEDRKEVISSVANAQNWEEVLGKQIAIKLIDDIFKLTKDKEIDVPSKNLYT